MTDTEFATRFQAIGAIHGRREMALAITEFVSTHASVLTSPAACDLAQDVVAYCQEILRLQEKA